MRARVSLFDCERVGWSKQTNKQQNTYAHSSTIKARNTLNSRDSANVCYRGRGSEKHLKLFTLPAFFFFAIVFNLKKQH